MTPSRDIAKDDPHCAMAHWGVAMRLWHQLWNEPDAKVIARGASEVKTVVSLLPLFYFCRPYS
ncbi:MAG: hypothetical protein LAP86_07840 [Acidobacteriia bacterium]|nr:hypothetical protein [Terriglobia bacterium]